MTALDPGIAAAMKGGDDAGIAAAYSATGAAWQRGPGRIYDRLAEIVIERSPVPLAGSGVVDVGCGTGAASRAAQRAGAGSVIGVDAAFGLLAFDRKHRPPAVAADARSLPFATGAFDVGVAAFSLTHVTHPVAGLRELSRVTRRGGGLVVASYADGDDHPVKAVVEALLRERGWKPAPWYGVLRTSMALMSTVERCHDLARAAGLEARVDAVRIGLPELRAADLVEWRLGMAQHAPFVARLSVGDRATLAADAIARLDAGDTLIRSVLVLTAIRT